MANLCNAMIGKGKRLSKRSKDLSNRFRIAYERHSFTQKQLLKRHFCKAHGIAEGTFRNKAVGTNSVSETEVEWIEKYDPYDIPQIQAA